MTGFSKAEKCGVSYWHIGSWSERGIYHGFVGRGVNIKESNDSWRRVFGSTEAGEFELRRLKQVHGIEICRPSAKQLSTEDIEADAWIVDARYHCAGQCSYGISTADCLPVLVVCPDAPVFAALHCGWRGTLNGLLSAVLEELISLGASPESIEIAIGPGAGKCCYAVGAEVAKGFEEAEKKIIEAADGEQITREISVWQSSNGQFMLDIGGLLILQAQSLGVQAAKIYRLKLCTICDDQFFSYRREKALSGRQVSFISPNPCG